KYNGGNNFVDNPLMKKWMEEGRIISVCPEYEGGLPVPRSASEICGGRVVNAEGEDVTEQFCRGAQIALDRAEDNGIKYAIFKQGSPSCGSKKIYDGLFRGRKINGMGIAARLLADNGIQIFDETEIDKLGRIIDGK
ncbi:MAG: DUF523 domain-containing protein, partial [Clostridia bacterium]|nr:DUF523 domain-containing protein [Clostridia bacterium]